MTPTETTHNEGDQCPAECGGTVDEELICRGCGAMYAEGQAIRRKKHARLFDTSMRPDDLPPFVPDGRGR
jgi:hypothetical protein